MFLSFLKISDFHSRDTRNCCKIFPKKAPLNIAINTIILRSFIHTHYIIRNAMYFKTYSTNQYFLMGKINHEICVLSQFEKQSYISLYNSREFHRPCEYVNRVFFWKIPLYLYRALFWQHNF